MSRTDVEIDFFRAEKEFSPKSQAKKLFQHRRSFRDIQSVISKLNPELLKTVIASGSVDRNNFNVAKSAANENSLSVPSTPKREESLLTLFPAFPLYTPSFGAAPETTPLTIFYDGKVAVFEVPRHKADSILRFAGDSKPVESEDPKLAMSSVHLNQLLDNLTGDLPIARKKSLQRFMEKRRERIVASPYGFSTD